MANNTLANQYCLIAFNGKEVADAGIVQDRRNRCLVTACFLGNLLSGKIQSCDGKYTIRYMEDSELSDLLSPQTEMRGLGAWIEYINDIPESKINKFKESFVNNLVEKGELDIVPSLQEADYEFRLSNLKADQYRGDYTIYHQVIERYKRNIFSDNPETDNICLTWLLVQSGDLHDVFSGEEVTKLESLFSKFSQDDSVSGEVFRCSLETGLKGNLKSYLIRMAEKFEKETIFIETEKMFPDSEECMTAVKNILESNGHICQVRQTGKVPVMEIDNVLYNLTPAAKRVRVINIHGVRLSRHI